MIKHNISEEEFAKHRNKTSSIEMLSYGEVIMKGCYCGHTDLCECSNPDHLTMGANSAGNLIANIPTLTLKDVE